MSLRQQINFRIFLASLCILLLGGSLAIWQARTAVHKAMEDSIQLSTQLIALNTDQSKEVDWIQRFDRLESIQHLSLQLRDAAGKNIARIHEMHESSDEKPPQWFIDLVTDAQLQITQTLTGAQGETLYLDILANPLPEIIEVWQESLAFFGSLFFLTLLSFLAVHLSFHDALKAIAQIVHALKTIEDGHYQQQLPEFASQELNSIAKAINHTTAELYKIQQENRALTEHTLTIQEEERQYLAQELHDELGQSLTAIKVMAVAAAHQNANCQQATGAIVEVCEHLMSVVRSMMKQLHPLVLTELGLKAALEDLLQHWELRQVNLQLSLDCPNSVDSLNQKITIQVFRVIQECLTNIVRHAEASQASICLTRSDNALRIQVSDNGKGCDRAALKTGFGLSGMRERIHSLNGQLRIDSEPQQGLSVTAIIPLVTFKNP